MGITDAHAVGPESHKFSMLFVEINLDVVVFGGVGPGEAGKVGDGSEEGPRDMAESTPGAEEPNEEKAKGDGKDEGGWEVDEDTKCHDKSMFFFGSRKKVCSSQEVSSSDTAVQNLV